MTRLFVTATGTDIGKTFVCCRLVEALAGRHRLRAVKPLATGFDPDLPGDSDTAALLAAQHEPVDAAGIGRTTPWHYRAPLAPDQAAAREGRSVPFDDVVAFCRTDDGADLTVIEGIGGAFVPLDDAHTVADWIAACQASVWVVAGSYLGSISHTLATLAALEARKLAVAAVVVSESAEPAAPLAEITASVERFSGPVPVLGLGRPPTAAQIEALAAAAQSVRAR